MGACLNVLFKVPESNPGGCIKFNTSRGCPSSKYNLVRSQQKKIKRKFKPYLGLDLP